VVYGTTQRTDRLYPGEFLVPVSFSDTTGLAYDTKFDVGRSVLLPYSDEYFSVPPQAPFGQVPKMGMLHPNLVRFYTAAQAELSG